MIYRREKLSEINNCQSLKNSKAVLTSFIIENSPEIDQERKRPAVLICPGGAYEFLSDREGEVVAQRFIANDINAFVLKYSIEKEKVYPLQLLEASAALAYIRKNAQTFKINPDKIIICGFSAGGHLAGNLGVSWQQPFIAESLGINIGENMPNGMILSYPVITGGQYAHRGSFDNLLGNEANEENFEKLSLEKLVTKNTPKTFIWHTFEDDCVPLENTMLFANALRKNEIPFEMHIYPKGGHGLSLADKSSANVNEEGHINPHVSSWFNLAVQWIDLIN